MCDIKMYFQAEYCQMLEPFTFLKWLLLKWCCFGWNFCLHLRCEWKLL